jgi:hypothetical protein
MVNDKLLNKALKDVFEDPKPREVKGWKFLSLFLAFSK